jgi:hypothetical protein
MARWEYCAVYVVARYREGGDPGTQELLQIRLPGKPPASVSERYDLMGLLNRLGSGGWELVDVEDATFYLKRRMKSTAGAAAGPEEIVTSPDQA